MTPEQKEKMKEKRKAAKEKYNSMTPLEKQAAKGKMKAKKKTKKSR